MSRNSLYTASRSKRCQERKRSLWGGRGGKGGGGVKCGKRQESIRKKDRADRGAGQKIKGSEFDCWFSGN